MANTLAKQTGFVVLAADLFKGESTKDPNRAMQLVKSVGNNPGEALSNMQAAVKYVRSLSFVDGSKIASIGWCFGGGTIFAISIT
jgi:carboxymethylenebutenolidase